MNDLSESDYRLIEAKIDGSMTDQEQDLFAQKLKDSKDFEHEFQTQNMVIESLVQSNNEVLRKEFRPYLEESKQQRKIDDARRTLMLAASLSFLVLCGIVYYLFSPEVVNHETIYQAYFEIYPAPPITRGNEVGANLSDFDHYRKGEYLQAIETFKSGPQSEMTPVYQAMCYLKTDQVNKAIEHLNEALGSSHLIVNQTAEWYLALAYLKENKVNKAQSLLKKITTEKQLYYKQALEILNKIS
ncbi:MAG: hypothetical protein ABJF04_25265 [Reichenbachiella sp.]|uniref:tetratricopeptide repeat protein n=1 Tax=Reichenbachiella sp. TaxID=2184521 RepID=UPI0032632DA4